MSRWWLVLALATAAARAAVTFELPSDRLRRHEPVTITVRHGLVAENPLDPEQLAVEARVRAASGERRIPGYLDQPCERLLDRGDDGRMREEYRPSGPPVWRIRFTPLDEGPHRLTIIVRSPAGEETSEAVELFARTAKSPGFTVRRRGEWPGPDGYPARPWIGMNLAWAGDEGTFAVDAALRKLGSAGANVVRLWLHSPTRTYDLIGADGSWDLAAAARLEAVLDAARVQGIGVILVLSSQRYAPAGFFTSAAWRARSRQMVRYLSARFGSLPTVVGWELCADVRGGGDSAIDWCGEMGYLLRELDPVDRPIGVSVADRQATADLVAGLPDLAWLGVPGADPSMAEPARWQTALGADAPPPADREAAARQLNDALWEGLLTSRVGPPLPWWWEGAVRRFDLYDRFAALAPVTSIVDWHDLRAVPVALEPAGWRAVGLAGARQWLAWVGPVDGAPRPSQVRILPEPDGPLRLGAYDPWTMTWTQLPARHDGHVLYVELPPGERDLVVVAIPRNRSRR